MTHTPEQRKYIRHQVDNAETIDQLIDSLDPVLVALAWQNYCKRRRNIQNIDQPVYQNDLEDERHILLQELHEAKGKKAKPSTIDLLVLVPGETPQEAVEEMLREIKNFFS